MLKRLALIFLLLTTCLNAKPITYNGQVFTDEEVAKLVTVITSTNPIPSIPNTSHLYQAQVSLAIVPVLRLCKKIIVFDGIPEHKLHMTHRYEEYKQSVIKLTETDPYFSNTELVFCEEWGHLSGAITSALKHVTTPFVLMHQHDLVVRKPFDLNGCVATLIANPYIKYIHFSSSANSDRSWNGPVDEKIVGRVHFVPLTRSFGWSDRTHIASVDYYKNQILPLCPFTFMENVVQKKIQQDFKTHGKGRHHIFGPYLYGNIHDGDYLTHTDGRNN